MAMQALQQSKLPGIFACVLVEYCKLRLKRLNPVLERSLACARSGSMDIESSF